MGRLVRHRPSPAMVVALLALFVALAGTGYAAVKLPRNSVGAAQLKKGAVTPPKVAKKTIALFRGRRGPAGPQGAPGAAGQTGPPGAPNPNADKLDSYDANGLTRVASMDSNNLIPLTSSDKTFGTPLSITAPAAGFVLVAGSMTYRSLGSTPCTMECRASGRIRHLQTNTHSALVRESVYTISSEDHYGTAAHAWVFPVAAGVNTFDFRVTRAFGGNGAIYANNGEMSAVYSPFGSTGAGTLGAGVYSPFGSTGAGTLGAGVAKVVPLKGMPPGRTASAFER